MTLRRILRRGHAGQSIILLALGMIVLLAFVGLVTDVSLLFVRFSQLRRAVDAASIAAAGQIRENRDYADIALSARQFIRLHGLDPERVLVQTCLTNPTDLELCTIPPRKLVRVMAQIDSPTTFLSLLGWRTVTLETSAVAETAALDVALVLDTSESMSRSTNTTHYSPITSGIRPGCSGDSYLLRWGGCCNDPGNGQVSLTGQISGVTSNAPDGDYSDLVCQPFKQVRDAARLFVQRMDFVRGDRVVFVTFNRDAGPILPDNPGGPGTLPPLITDENIAIQTLNKKIGVNVNPTGRWVDCPTFTNVSIPAWSYDWAAPCNDTNLGGGLLAGNQALTDPLYVRRNAVWVMIVLSDGAANATPRAVRNNVEVSEGEYGYHGFCPWWTFCDPHNPAGPGDYDPNCTKTDDGHTVGTWCSDNDPATRHFCMTSTGRVDLAAPNCDVDYDATDFAMDMADFAGLVEVMPGVPGNFIAMYTIGFGVPGDPLTPLGEATLRYIADAGDNGLIDNNAMQDCRRDGICGNEGPPYNPAIFGPPDACEGVPHTENCGQYWYADNLEVLNQVFTEIASRLFTRLAR